MQLTNCCQVSFLVFLEAAQEVQEDYWRDRVSGGDQGEEAPQDQELRYLAEVRLQVWNSQHVPRVQGPHCLRRHHPVLQGHGS